jgi:aryl-alcohol dehydrogenase-like predicted oxidoreductase
LAKEDHIIPIPGSRDCAHLEENLGALDVVVTNDVMMALESVFTADKIFGNRYDSVSATNVDTEKVASP